MRGNNFHHANVTGLSIAPVVVGNATASGATISEPWRTGRQLTFIIQVGVLGGTATYSFEVRVRGSATWKDLMDSASTPVDVTVIFTNTQDGTQREATINLRDIDSDTYDAIRIVVTATDATDAVGVSHVISDLYRKPGGDANALPGTFTMPFTYEA